jgi:putative transposase
MTALNPAPIGADLIDRLIDGRDARAVFDRDGVLDQLRLALSERFQGQARRVAGRTRPAGGDRLPPNLTPDAAKDRAETYQIGHPDFVDRVVSLHARGRTMADIQRATSLLLGRTVSYAVIECVLAEMRQAAADWRTRALEPSYPIVVFERIRVKWRQGAQAQNRLCHFALGFQAHGPKEVLGLWLESGESEHFWSTVLDDLKERGVNDVLYFLGSSPQLGEAQRRTFPAARTVLHVGDFVRRSLQLVVSKDRSAVMKALRGIHGAASIAQAFESLCQFENSVLGGRYPGVSPIWRRNWDEVGLLYEMPLEVRRVVASTFAADELRRAFKHKMRGDGHLSDAESAAALMYLAVRAIHGKWKRPQREWHAAKTRLASLYPDRFGAS